MDSLDELLNFSSDIGEEDDEDDKPRKTLLPPSSSTTSSLKKFNGVLGQDDPSRSFHGAEFSCCFSQECAEEELEWISNKDLFPALESFVDILSDHQVGIPKHQSPVSVLDSSTTSSNSNNSNSNSHSHSTNSNSNTTLISSCGSLKAPRRARSKRRCRRRRATFADLLGRQLLWTSTNSSRNTNANANGIVKVDAAMTGTTTIGRKCLHCGAEKTPQWRAGPLGPKTLCNACGVRYKSGRLAPEYRPASSPTFSNDTHSNSHRKVMEMRRVKQMMGVGVKPLGTG
ncbi:hypothetical protein FEM48_Zijuj07G0078100 [Ziziphus jujuba var. spinosa]|uniref:GATA-type domain-containing protein n=1 Tax=Ziziphus jujuba var. spinosa TaxID=714518 RepID=A0A978V3D9_ZIZJJ|nr:hypothetical protein FEM48_Zijuj07G0078100 [Ziziphus jujuba var. spinosa]